VNLLERERCLAEIADEGEFKPEVIEAALRRLRHEAASQALATLSGRARAVLDSLFVDGLSLGEVSKMPELGFRVGDRKAVARVRDKALATLRGVMTT
jgi:DNA-directed RNA polymerase specialized sigma24 family protein